MRRLLSFGLLCMFLCCGCTVQKEGTDKLQDLEFTVVREGELSEELKNIIEQKKQNPFKMTYEDKQNLYIIVGYGEQNTGGYSIAVKELFLSDNAIHIKTNLIGPKKEEKTNQVASYPYVVVKLEYRDEMVVFN